MREILVGDRLDQYEITDLLARSGMAAVYRARDVETGEGVALKVPHLQFESDVVFHERFRREEELGQKLDHPSIIKFLRPRDKSRMYIAMELVEGTSLRALLQAERTLSAERALDIARKLGEALVYLHGRRVVHRDLKPENVLVLPDGRVKLLDFGIALDESARRLTWFGLSSTVGTPDYMAPEQVGGRRGDARTDVYALGTMLYEMLTGHLPYTAASAGGIVRAKTHEPPSGRAATSPASTLTWKRSSSTPSSPPRATATPPPPPCSRTCATPPASSPARAPPPRRAGGSPRSRSRGACSAAS